MQRAHGSIHNVSMGIQTVRTVHRERNQGISRAQHV